MQRTPKAFDQLAQEAMQLPAASRAQLADKLVDNLDSAEIDEIQRLWAAEAIRRRDEVRSGHVKPIPGEEVMTSFPFPAVMRAPARRS